MGDKPVFRVGVAGLDARELRLMGIVFRHSQYNRYEFRLADVGPVGEFDILIANVTASQGQRAITEARERATPIIAALPRGASAAAGGMVPAEGHRPGRCDGRRGTFDSARAAASPAPAGPEPGGGGGTACA